MTKTDAPKDWWIRAGSWLVLAFLLGLVAFCGLWRIQGGRWERVETPSMGTVAPVGTLLWIKPTNFEHLKVGDFITFHPPGEPDFTYSHRVYSLNADGTVSTKGVIPAPDPWKLTSKDLVGKVEMRWWGVGWLVKAAPVLIIGFALVAMIRFAVGRDWKLPVTILLTSLVLSVAITWYRPFINAQQLSFAPDAKGGAVATYVGTGLLPIRLSAHNEPHREATGTSLGSSVVMSDGEVGSIRVQKADRDHRLRIDLKPAVAWWVWALIILGCLLPALYSLIVGLAPLPPGKHRGEPPSGADH